MQSQKMKGNSCQGTRKLNRRVLHKGTFIHNCVLVHCCGNRVRLSCFQTRSRPLSELINNLEHSDSAREMSTSSYLCCIYLCCLCRKRWQGKISKLNTNTSPKIHALKQTSFHFLIQDIWKCPSFSTKCGRFSFS